MGIKKRGQYRTMFQNILLVIVMFFITTFAVFIVVLIPISLLEDPLHSLIVDTLGWSWTKNDLRIFLAVGFAFWLGFYWARKDHHPNFLTKVQRSFSNQNKNESKRQEVE